MKKLSVICVLCSALFIAGCSTKNDVPYNEEDFAMGGPDAPMMNERTVDFMRADNPFAHIDSLKPQTAADKAAQDAKWNTSRMDTRWQEYRGTMVRVQILLGDSDLREMRLRLMQNSNGIDVDRDSRGVLARVADFEMKKVCGRNADSYVIVYDKPSFDVMRPSPYFDYAIESGGSVMREYGFRCIYNN